MNIHELDLNLLLVFNAIYVEKSISRAAKRLGISQPAASNALRRLRDFTGDTLFYKSGSGMAPTRAAQALAVPISHALETVERSISSMRSFDPATSNRTFRVGVNDLINAMLVPTLVGVVRREAPNVMLEFVTQPPLTAREALLAGEFDLALLPEFLVNDGLTGEQVMIEPFSIAISKTHPLAKKNQLTMDDVRSLKYVATSHVPKLRAAIDEVFRRQGLNRDVVCYVADTHSLYPLVAVSDLAAVVGHGLAAHSNAEGNLVLLEPPFDVPAVAGYVAWAESNDSDQGHEWLRTHALNILKSAFKLQEDGPKAR